MEVVTHCFVSLKLLTAAQAAPMESNGKELTSALTKYQFSPSSSAFCDALFCEFETIDSCASSTNGIKRKRAYKCFD
jgi:hypothetical protein